MSKLTLIALAATVCVAAQDRPLVFHVGAELVVLDVIATDANGREVSDLTPAEVQIQEDGSPRPVQQAVGQDIVTEGNRRMLYTTYALTGLARSLDAMPVLELSPERMNAIRASDKVAVRLDSPAPSPGTYVLTVVARDSGGWIAADTSEVVVQR
jgi:hypothetical protein